MTNIAIKLPQDAFLHVGAPREWWWHIGTLEAGGRSFGFEINAAGFVAQGASPGVCFSQVMLTDPLNKKHYKRTSNYEYDPAWAESYPSRPWYARIGDLSSRDFVFMQQVGGIGTLDVQASFTDDADPLATVVRFNLQMAQQGPPLYVWGTGVAVNVDPTGTTPLARNNYYYSYTNLRVSGTVQIGDEKPLSVAGVTWMDHEYGAFGAGTQWVLQDAQLSNGVSFTSSRPGSDFSLKEGERLLTLVTVLENGVSTSTIGFATPTHALPVGKTTFYTHWRVEIPAHAAVLQFEALLPDQVFPGDPRPIYEGAATVTGTFDGLSVTGPGWLEQALTAPGPAPGSRLGRGASRAGLKLPENATGNAPGNAPGNG